jgi:hypothetical protein
MDIRYTDLAASQSNPIRDRPSPSHLPHTPKQTKQPNQSTQPTNQTHAPNHPTNTHTIQLMDIRYTDLIASPSKTIEGIYAKFHLPGALLLVCVLV